MRLREICIKFGWLKKKGKKYAGKKRASKRRFFVLHQEKRLLYYFFKETSVKAKGYIDLSPGCTVKPDDVRNSAFIIHDAEQGRDFTIKTPNEKECNEWITILNSVINS